MEKINQKEEYYKKLLRLEQASKLNSDLIWVLLIISLLSVLSIFSNWYYFCLLIILLILMIGFVLQDRNYDKQIKEVQIKLGFRKK